MDTRERGRVDLRPDYVLERDGAAVYVADAKYKLTVGRASNDDFYQLLAYVTARGLGEGMYHLLPDRRRPEGSA